MDNATIMAGLATSLVKQGRAQEASELYHKALMLLPESNVKRATLLAALASTYATMGSHKDAEEFYRQALNATSETDDRRSMIYVGLGAACIELGKGDEAEQFYRNALTHTNPGVPQQRSILAGLSKSQQNSDHFRAKLLDRLPPDVHSDWLEAKTCRESGCWNAFGALARRVVHSICADLGSSKGDLFDQIEELHRDSRLSADEAAVAHELRTLGRNGVHPEWEPVSENMTAQGWGLLSWLIGRLYDPPPSSPQWGATTKRRYAQPKQPQVKGSSIDNPL